jgi:hypothetical protein
MCLPSSFRHLRIRKTDLKLIPWWRHHLSLDVVVQKTKSPCRHAEEVVDVVVVALIFNIVVMEKMNPPYPLTVAERRRR